MAERLRLFADNVDIKIKGGITMCDFFDNFDDFGENGFMDDDSLEDEYDADTQMDDPLDGDIELDNEPDEGDDLTFDPFFIGGAMGFAYEAGVEERHRKRLLKEQSKRRKRKKFRDDSD
jgi:hypothetical protein